VQTVQERQGLYISAPEEIAFRRGFLTAEDLRARGEALGKTAYGRYLIDVANGLHGE
jgi:glucose-1-phosphate thymidylyltransferase